MMRLTAKTRPKEDITPVKREDTSKYPSMQGTMNFGLQRSLTQVFTKL